LPPEFKNKFTGLTDAEVSRRINDGLQNKSAKPQTKTLRKIFIENIFSVFNLVIFSIIIFLIYFFLKSSDKRLMLDSIGILTIAFINTFLAIFQEIKAKRALDKVRLLLKRDVTVLRNGKEVTIEPSEIVVDDVIVIQRGDQVVVDGKVIYSNHLEIDESLLTGESNPIHKKQDDEILSGSFCLSGNGYYKAEKIGNESYAAQITSQAKKYKFDLTPLQKKINFIVKILFVVAIVLVIVEIALNQNGFNPDFVRKISTILISLVPQGMVLMATVTFAVGVYRISNLGAIVQKLNAIESFSNVQVVCMDKTGTLTQNKLAISSVHGIDVEHNSENLKSLIGTYAELTSDKNATINALSEYKGDSDCKLVDEFPFSSERKMSMVQYRDKGEFVTLVLGAFDVIMNLLQEDKKMQCENIFAENQLSVYRNLLLAKIDTENKPEEIKDNLHKAKINPLCIISITDKIREDVFDAIKLFQENGIRIKILSGDSSKAIQEVAREIGWDIKDSDMISGSELEKSTKDDFDRIVLDKTIFSRLKPEHKLMIIKSLKKKKIYTAMIGDGVNDLPAIKESDMGIAMEEGSSITKEIADIVLLKNKFSLLPAIFDEGNKIVNTVKSVGKLFVTKNFFVIYITLLSVFFLLDFPLTPRRVSLINIFGIGLPAFIITMKNSDISKTKHFMRDLISFVLISALVIVGSAYIGTYVTEKFYSLSEKDIQMVMLTIMIIINIANYFSITITKDDQNKLIYILYGFGILILYMFFAATSSEAGILALIKKFYEIDFVRPELWSVILAVSLAGSVILFIAQKLRSAILLK